MSTLIARAAPVALSIVLVTPLVAATQTQTQTAERSRTQGLKETDRFVKAGASTSQSLLNAEAQVHKTLDAYNALVTQPTTNMKGDYKKLMKSTDSMNSRVADARQKVEQMQQAGDTYFAGRAEGIKGIQDAQLQDRAKQRMADSQRQFASVLQSLRDTAQALEPFRKELADQITYLGSDLTPSAMTSLKPNADKLNAHGADLFGRTDKALADANAYFQGLKSSES